MAEKKQAVSKRKTGAIKKSDLKKKDVSINKNDKLQSNDLMKDNKFYMDKINNLLNKMTSDIDQVMNDKNVLNKIDKIEEISYLCDLEIKNFLIKHLVR
jgi:hypothetical protein